MKRIVSLALVLALLTALFTGCKKQGTAGETKQSDTTEPTAASAQAVAYKAVSNPLPEPLDTVQAAVFTDSALFLAAMTQSEETTQDVDETTGKIYGYYKYESTLYREDLVTGQIAILEFPSEGFGRPQVNALVTAADGSVWALCQTSESDAEDAAYVWFLVRFAADGTYQETVRLDFSGSQLEQSQVYLNRLVLDGAGNFVCADYSDTVYIFGKTGALIKALDQDGKYGNLVSLSNQAGILFYADAGGMNFRPIDAETLSWCEEVLLPIYTWDIFSDTDGNAFYYFDDGSIYRYDLDTQQAEKTLDLLNDCDLDATELTGLNVEEAGNFRVLLGTQGSGVDTTYELYDLQPIDPSALPEKTVLTLASLSPSQPLRQQVAKFNRENDRYRIEVLDYSEYSEIIASPGSYTEDSSSAILKLNTELLSGNLPDLIDVSGGELPVAQYAVKGFLEDLLPYLNADSAVSPDKLMESVLNAVKTDGKLYQLPTSFQVVSAAGKREIVGGYESWTTDEVEDALKKLPEGATVFNVDYTKSHVLYLCASGAMNRFVDWQAGTCSFDSDEFRSILSFANTFPDEFDTTNFDFDEYQSDYRRVGQGQQLLANIAFASFDDIYYQFAAMDNDVCFVGYPGASDGLGSGFVPLGAICMTTACKDKDGAWGFIRSLLSMDAQMQSPAFPMLKSAFEQQAEAAMQQDYVTDEDGNPILDASGNPIPVILYTVGFFSETVDVYAVTPEQYKAVCDLIDRTTSVFTFDENLMNILTEETAAYFAGAKTLDETAAMIQNRASLYIAEQK